MSHNQFFKNNALKPLSRATSYSSDNHRNPDKGLSQAKSNSICKIDAKNFTHRQVFNSKLYQTASVNLGQPQKQFKQSQSNSIKKFFKISLSQKQRVEGKLGDEQGLFMKQSHETVTKQEYFQNKSLQKSWKSLFHYFNIVDKLVRVSDPKNPLKIAIKNINEQLQQVLSILFSQHRKALNKINEYNLNITSLSRNHNLTRSKSTYNYDIEQILQTKKDILKHQIGLKNYKDLKVKSDVLQFQNKKMVLLCEQLELDLKNKSMQCSDKFKQCQALLKKVSQVDKQRQGYQFKIRKLKQQLQVAHIVKQQNLADKVNYILGWKL